MGGYNFSPILKGGGHPFVIGYLGLDVWIWMGVNPFLGAFEGVAPELKSRLFWAQMALAMFVPISGPKNVSISGPTPSKKTPLVMDYSPIIHTSCGLPHINNRYISS